MFVKTFFEQQLYEQTHFVKWWVENGGERLSKHSGCLDIHCLEVENLGGSLVLTVVEIAFLSAVHHF